MMLGNLELKLSNILPRCQFQHLKQIHALLISTSLTQDVHIFFRFLRRSTEFGTMDYSSVIFSRMGHGLDTEIILWNTMIRGYAFNGHVNKCVQLFDEMRQRGVKPHNYTYPYVLNCCSQLRSYRKGKTVHCQIIKSGFESNSVVTSSLFNMYIKLQSSLDDATCKLNDARKVFDEMWMRPVEAWNLMISGYASAGDLRSARQLFATMPTRDIVSWNSMISCYAKAGELANARELFEQMPEKNVISWTSMIGAHADAGDLETARTIFEKMPCRNVVSWNSLLSSYTKHGKYVEALNLFLRMQSESVIPDGHTFVSVLSACSNLGTLDFGKYIHYLIGDWCGMEIMVGTALVEMYAKCGDINTAFAVFTKVEKDVFCWNVMIRLLAIHGRTEDAVKMFFSTQKTGLKPNDFTFTSALFACSHGGMVEEGCRIFQSMETDYKMSPKPEHFGCIIDLLSRNGRLEEAELLVKDMPFKPDMAIWGALLGGCRVTRDLKLAENVVERVGELEESGSGIYVLLSNIYALEGHWVEAVGARERMEKLHIGKKKAGSSSVL